MSMFRKKPVVIEARRLDKDNDPDTIAVWCGGRVAPHPDKVYTGGPLVILIDTLEGVMMATPGDWIIKGVQGEFYPCKDSIFQETYEPADDPA